MKFPIFLVSSALLVFCGCGIHKKSIYVENSSFEMRLVDETRKSGKEFPVRSSKETLFLEPDILVSGKDIDSVDLGNDSFGRAAVEIQFTPAGSKTFAELTARHEGRRLAIVVKGSVLTTPTIREKIPGGRLQITGSFSMREAQDIMNNIAGK